MKQQYQELLMEMKKKISELEIIDQVIGNMNASALQLLDNQQKVMDDIHATAKKMNEKQGFFEYSLDKDGIQISHEKTGIDFLLIKFKVCLNFTVIALVNVYKDIIEIVITEKDHIKQTVKLNRSKSQLNKLQQKIGSIFDAKKELQSCRDQLEVQIQAVTNELLNMYK